MGEGRREGTCWVYSGSGDVGTPSVCVLWQWEGETEAQEEEDLTRCEAVPGLASTFPSSASNLGFLLLSSLRFEGWAGVWFEEEKSLKWEESH